MTFVLEFFSNVLGYEMDEFETGFFNPYHGPSPINPKPGVPTHYTTEGGGTYSARPDLTRAGGPGTYVTMGAFGMGVAITYTSAVVVSGYAAVIEDESPDTQKSLWRSFSQALTGGFGAGSWSY
ncbi:MAG: hypothetical protein [Circular genetic element sp.]|nr:MAG: hypothetical protein [Circular genetic element sp.]